MTLAQFAEIFALLAVQLRATDADEATIRGYFEALKDLEPELIALAAKQLAISAAWFPKTSEWREAVALVDRDRTDAQKALLRKLPQPLCLACADTGWERIEVGEASHVRPCSCRRSRRLEVLGRRPWPELPPVEPPDLTQEARLRVLVGELVKIHEP